jgi:hypothetical protein
MVAGMAMPPRVAGMKRAVAIASSARVTKGSTPSRARAFCTLPSAATVTAMTTYAFPSAPFG